jgi:RNA polymerase sigma factor (sigma-70 family)
MITTPAAIHPTHGMSDSREPGAAEDRRLLAALAAGDRTAAERLVEGSYRQVYGLLLRLCGGDADLAADLTQDTYRKAWAALPGFDGRAQFSTWLCRIGYTTFLNQIRRPRLMVALEERHEAAVEDPAPTPEEQAGTTAGDERLRRAVMALPEPLRFAVTSHFWGESPVAEIAQHEGVTAVAIRKRLKKALAALARALEEDVV